MTLKATTHMSAAMTLLRGGESSLDPSGAHISIRLHARAEVVA